MEPIVTLAVAVGIGYWAYSTGKRNGSKAAYKVGWRRGRAHHKRQS